MSKSCQGMLKELVKCLRESDCFKVTVRPGACGTFVARPAATSLRPKLAGDFDLHTTMFGSPIRVQKEGKDITTCAREVDTCAGLRNAYAACKRGQLDPRARIRGNKGY